MLSETHITDDFEEGEIKIQGYKFVSCNSHSRHTGGTAMFVDENIKFDVIFNERKNKTWILCIRINDGLMKGIYTVVYKSPKEKITDFLSFFDEFLEENSNDNTNNLIAGDFNINVAIKSCNSKKYLDKIEEYNLKQIVEDYTRVDEKRKSKTLIDHILTNNCENIHCEVIKSDRITDHFMIEIKLNVAQKHVKEKSKIKILSWKNYNTENMMSEVAKISWNNEVCENPDIASEFIMQNLKNCVDMLTEEKLIFESRNQWYNSDLKKQKIEKDLAYKKYEYTKTEDDKNFWLELSKKYKEAIEKSKCSHVQKLLTKHKNCPKKL